VGPGKIVIDDQTVKTKTTLKDWLKILVLLLDEVVVIVAIVFVLNYLGVRIPLPIMIIGGLFIAILVFVIHIKVIPSFHWKQVTGREAMIGQEGQVVQSLKPVGTIVVKGEIWKAESVGEYVEVGRSVTIVEMKGLKLRVVCGQED